MTSQPIEANVVLTADNSQYDQAMMASAGSTNNLVKALDSLGDKISKVTKSAGKSLIGISAADVALIGAATTAWASYEKQMSRLQAQAAIMGRGREQETRVMKDYTASVKAMRTEFGVTTSEAAKLTETLGRMTNLRQSRDLTALSKVFGDMSKATGESSAGLAASLTNLQKVMGTDINSANTRKYADMFTYLGQQTQTSTQGLIDFTAQLAPVGEAMGINTKQLAGFATAFSRAGQEGYGAATVFNKIATDITKSLATGSSEVAHYANLVGVSVQSFQQLEGAEQVVRVLEALQAQGAGAAAEMNRLGLDGPRSIKSLQAVIGQAGGVRQALGLAETGAASGAAAEGAEAAMAGLSDEFEKLREQVKMTAETMGKYFAPVMQGVVSAVTEVVEVVNQLAEGPFGEFAAMLMGVLGPLAAGGGALLLFAGTLLKVAAAFTALRNSASLGIREGFAGGAGIAGVPGGGYAARGGGMLGPRGAQIAEGGTWLQRGLYNVGQAGGAGLSGLLGGIGESWMRGREWADPNYRRPEVSRGPLSYLAGGIGRSLDLLVTPQFDQMRYADPTKRNQWLNRVAPWSRMAQQGRLDFYQTAAGETAEQLTRTRQQEAAVRSNLVMTETARAERLSELRTEREATKQRLFQAQESARVIKTEMDARAEHTRSVRESTTGFTRLGRSIAGFAGGAGGAVGGGLLAAGQMIGRSPLAAPLAGMAGAGILGAAGVESNAAMMGAFGLSFGAVGGGVGFAAGAVMDAAAANDRASESVKMLTDQATEASRSGVGLSALADTTSETRKQIDELSSGYSVTSKEYWLDLGTAMGSVKNSVEGIFGSSDIEELNQGLAEGSESAKQTEASVRALAEATGTTFTGTPARQREQMDEFMATIGGARLAEAGITLPEFTAMRRGGIGGTFARIGVVGRGGAPQGGFNELLEQIASGLDQTVEARLIAGGGTGEIMARSATAQRAMKYQDDVALFYQATNEIFSTAVSSGKDYLQIMKEAEEAQKTIGDENDRGYELQMAVAQKAQQGLAVQAQVGTRVEAFQAAIGQMQVLGGITPTTPEQATQLEAMKGQTAAAIADQVNYFKQLLLQQEQYEIQRARAEQDYNLQRSYALYDYNLQRSRAEDNFYRQRNRAEADFQRNVRRTTYDFHLQRQRQEDDFHHQQEVQAKQRVMSMNLYQRVETQRTSSAAWLSSNAGDILTRMRQQVQDLRRLRQFGISDEAIQLYGLASPENAQQLARLVSEMDAQTARRFNRQASALTRVSGRLGRDQGNLEAAEAARAFRIGRERSAEDFERQMQESRRDFRRGLRQQRFDFNLMMDQQADDFDTAMKRQEKAYKTSMDRSAEDLANAAKEIDMSFNEILKRATTELTGHAQEQAIAIKKTFKDLKNETSPEAIALMEDLSLIFGFEYKAPKGLSNNAPYQGSQGPPPGVTVPGTQFHADGGVVAGWTPGRDTQTVHVSGGEAIMRPEWARAMGEGAINAMNHQAKYGGFAQGGVVWPVPGRDTGTYPGHTGVDINRGSGWDDLGDPIRAARGGQVVHAGWGRGYGNAIMIQVPGGPLTIYGHASRVGVQTGQSVRTGQYIGAVGDTGNSSAPHLHFEVRPGSTYASAMAFLRGANTGAFAGFTGAASNIRLGSLLKDRYPDPEAAARAMQGVHPLFPGDISHVINRFARSKIRALREIYGPTGVSGVAAGAALGDLPDDPGSGTARSNQRLGKQMAMARGWGRQWPQLLELWNRESGWNHLADNPTSSAYGIPQALIAMHDMPAGYVNRTTGSGEYTHGYGGDPRVQIAWGLNYIGNRYGNPANALAFHNANNWYRDGSVFTSARTIGVGENGPEAVIPLNARGGNFLADVMGSVMGGRNVGAIGRGGNIYATRIDHSTNFTGPITVQANDPAELISKLKARQRVMALSRPSLTGSAA